MVEGFESSVLGLLFIYLFIYFFTYLYNYSFLWRNIHQNCRTPSFGKKQWLGKWCRRWLNYISFSTTYLHFLSALADSCLLYVREDPVLVPLYSFVDFMYIFYTDNGWRFWEWCIMFVHLLIFFSFPLSNPLPLEVF